MEQEHVFPALDGSAEALPVRTEEIPLDALRAAYEEAERTFDIAGRGACMTEAFRQILEHPAMEQSEAGQFFAARPRIFLLAALDALARGAGAEGLFYLGQIDEAVLASPAWFPAYRYYKAWGCDLTGEDARAAQHLGAHIARFPADAAAKSCLAALRAGAPRAWCDAGVRAEEIAGHCDIPIFINSRDRVGCLRALVGRLLSMGYRNLIVLDNGSTYAPLLSYYAEAERQGVRVLRLPNLGHRALWASGALDTLGVTGAYAYTDSDVVPKEACPADFVRRLLCVLRDFPYLIKAGTALAYADVTFYDRAKIRAIEERLYTVPLAKDCYFADVDTTFAVYPGRVRYYVRGPAARLAGACTVRHLPWYYDYANLPADEAYYLAHAGMSSSLKAFAAESGKTEGKGGIR